MRDRVPIATIAGIRISAHWSVLLIGVFLAWGIAQAVIPAGAPGTPVVVAWAVGLFAAALLIASLAAHELGHALLARRRGVAVEGITLWMFGGMAQIRGDWASPRTEIAVAAIGPAITLVIALAFGGIAAGLVADGAPALVVVVPEWLATVNVMLLVFNLIPAFPLDGGRILRGVMWLWRRDRNRATVAAARAGRVFAILLVLLGFAQFFITGAPGGLWLVLVGWFLDNAARTEERSEQARHALEGVRVAEVMTHDPIRVPSWITVQLLIEQYVLRYHASAFVTHGIDGRVEGLVALKAIRQVPGGHRSERRARDIATPVDRVPAARPDELLLPLLERMSPEIAEGHALVYEEAELVGIVAPAEIGRLLQSGALAGGRSRAA